MRFISITNIACSKKELGGGIQLVTGTRSFLPDFTDFVPGVPVDFAVSIDVSDVVEFTIPIKLYDNNFSSTNSAIEIGVPNQENFPPSPAIFDYTVTSWDFEIEDYKTISCIYTVTYAVTDVPIVGAIVLFFRRIVGIFVQLITAVGLFLQDLFLSIAIPLRRLSSSRNDRSNLK